MSDKHRDEERKPRTAESLEASALGSLRTTLADHVAKYVSEAKALADRQARMDETYVKIAARERTLPREAERTMAPGRQAAVLEVWSLLQLPMENPPRDSTALAKLTAIVEQETATRAARRAAEVATVRAAGLTALATESGIRIGTNQ